MRATGDAKDPAGDAGRVRAGERRRYWFQLVANLGFAAAWVMVAVLSGAWVFVVLAVLCAGWAVLAGGCLVVLRRRADRERP